MHLYLENKNGIYQWQIGEYISKKRQFVIKFSDQTFITDWRKVIAWKYVWKGDLNWSYGERMRRTLIVIDMQNDFIDGSLGTKEAKVIVEPVKS